MKENNDFLTQSAVILSEFLTPYIPKIEDVYNWSFDQKKAADAVKVDFYSLPNWYHKTVKLKESLSELIKNAKSFEERYEYGRYFVVEFGGVRESKNLKEILRKYDNIGDLSSTDTLAGVSSWSKYLSLRNPEAAIYDSRVAYSINTLNYIHNNTGLFFPMPNGRSTKLSLLDIETLFLKEKIKSDNGIINGEDLNHRLTAKYVKSRYCIPAPKTYPAYLMLLNMTAEKLSLNLKEKHMVEMLLFALAPREILQELINKIKRQSSILGGDYPVASTPS